MNRRHSRRRKLLLGATPLDVAEALQAEIERIDALASVLVEHLGDLRRGSAAERRFCRLVGVLADACEEAHAAGSEAIGQVARAGRSGR